MVIAAAMMAAMGYRGREQTVGIDLGTTFSVIAVRSGGKVVIMPDRFTNRPLVPSVVSYANDMVIVGEPAVAMRGMYPNQTIFNSKRFIGRSMKEVEDDSKNHPFRIVPNTSDDTVTDSREAEALFSIPSTGGDRQVSPIDVGAEVVRHLKQSAAAFMGYDMKQAVICVPAKFSSKETAATQKAFQRAGIKVMRVLEEPTAAAVAYNLHKTTGVRHVLVYDIGGGTLDTSLLYMNGKSVNVLGVAGDDHLGGSDFDHRMLELLLRKLDGTGAFLDAKVETDVPAEKLPECSRNGLRVESERAKIRLSSAETTDVQCRPVGGGAVRKFAVTREEFETACKDLFDRAIEPVSKVLEDQVMTPDNVDDVVLVGGASRMPQLRELLRRFFGEGKRLHTEIDPDVTVAYGAANIID